VYNVDCSDCVAQPQSSVTRALLPESRVYDRCIYLEYHTNCRRYQRFGSDKRHLVHIVESLISGKPISVATLYSALVQLTMNIPTEIYDEVPRPPWDSYGRADRRRRSRSMSKTSNIMMRDTSRALPKSTFGVGSRGNASQRCVW
jgi:hypothetical protein